MPSVDSLDIKIAGDAKKAEQALDSLVNSLSRVKTSLHGIESSGLKNFSNSMSDLNKFKFDNKGVQNFTNSLARMGKNNSVEKVNSIVNGFKELSNLNFDNKGLKSLIDSIGRLGKANVENVDFSRLSGEMLNFANTMSQANTVDRSTIQITNAVAALAKQGKNIGAVSSTLPSLSNALLDFTNKMSNIKTVSDNTIQFTKAIGELASAGKRTADTTSGLSALSRELLNVFATLSKAPKLRGDIVAMTTALGNLAKAGSKTSYATKSLSKGLNMFSASAGKATKHSFSLASAIGKVYATYWLLFRAFGKIGEAIDISSDLTEVQNVVDVTFGKYRTMVEDMAATSITDFGMSELTVKQISSRFQAMGGAMGFAQGKMADMSIELTKLAADMASFYNVEQKDVAEDLESIFTGQTRPLRTYGLDLTEATLKEWAMKQGLDANIDSMSQMEKTMLRYQYVLANTTAAQGDFSRTADTWANQIRILKQNFEQLAIIIGRVFINSLKPLVKALNQAMTHIVAFAQTVSDALGKIFGWKYEANTGGIASDLEDGSGAADDLSTGLGNAADNAKKLKQQLRGFDELNVLTSSTDSGNAGGSAGTGTGITSAGQVDVGKWVEEEEKFFDSFIDNLYELGEYIGTTLSNAMKNIDWQKVYQGAKDFGKGLAQFLNGLINTDLFADLGTTIAGALNTALYSLNSFGKEFDWTGFGNSIAEGINNFFRTFDFKTLAETINVWIKGALESVTTLLKKTDFEQIGKKIGQFIAELDLVGISADLAEALWEAIKAAANLLVGLFKEAPIETAFVSAFALLKFGNITSQIASALAPAISSSATAATVTSAISTAATAIGGAFVAAIGGFWAGKTLGSILFPDDKEFYENFKWSDFFDKLNPEDAKGAWEEFWKELTGKTEYDQDGETFGGGSGKHTVTIGVKADTESAKASAKEINEAFASAGAGRIIAYTRPETEQETQLTKATLSKNLSQGERIAATAVTKAPNANDASFATTRQNLVKALGPIGAQATINKLNLAKDAKSVSGVTANLKKLKASGKAKQLTNITAQISKANYGKLSAKDKTVSGITLEAGDIKVPDNTQMDVKLRFVDEDGKVWNFQGGKWFTMHGGQKTYMKKDGGIFDGQRWHPITQYAGGGIPSHGTHFIAGENGAEVVGHVGGRTEVLNESQLARVMYSSVQSANAQTNALLRQQNELLLGILRKETGINYKEVFRAAQKGAREYTQTTGRYAF